MEKKYLTFDDIKAAEDIEILPVDVPEWGGAVFVKGMTGQERDNWESALVKRSGKKAAIDLSDVRAKLCALTICDENGNRLFSEKDVKWLTLKSASALQRVYEVAQELSGITDEDVEELAEELEENPFDSSASD